MEFTQAYFVLEFSFSRMHIKVQATCVHNLKIFLKFDKL